MIPLTGFAPGTDPTTDGVILDCSNLIPTVRGSMVAAGIGESVGALAIPAEPFNVSSNLLLDGSSRVFAYTATDIYELTGGAWINRSRAGGYSATTSNKWRFCQFGDVSIATDYANEVQQSTTSGAFSNLTGGPPKATICTTAAGFVMLFDYNDGVNVFHDGWWCSGLFDHTTWSPSAATQAANGRLLDTPGKITAARRLGSSVVAYKNKSMYLGQYVGPPIIWQWTQITDDTGAFCQESVVSTGGVHYFLGENGIFAYDGSRPQQIGTVEVREWLRQNINPLYKENVKASYDSKNSLIFFFYPSNLSGGTCDEALVYNTVTGQFGRMTRTVKAIFDYVSPNINWGQAGALYATYGDWPSTITWGGPQFYGASVGVVYVGSDNLIYKVESKGAPSSLTIGDMGDDTFLSTLQMARLRFFDSPDSAQMTNYFKAGEGETLTQDKTIAMNDFKFDVLRTARFHRLRIDFTGSHEVKAIDVKTAVRGTR